MDAVLHGIRIDYSRDALFDKLGLQRIKESNLRDDETSPQERFAFVANAFGSNPEHAQRLYDYASKHWLSFATPILSYGREARALPISCFLNYLEDTAQGLVENLAETCYLSMSGGGVGVHVRMRAATNKSVGVVPHCKVYDMASLAFRQGTTRRGSFAVFLDDDHPDLPDFIDIRKATGDPTRRVSNLNHGINISDEFMEVIRACMVDPDADDAWPLLHPKTREVVKVVSARHIWEQIIETRMQTGEPYLNFTGTIMRAMPPWLTALGLKNNGSNICTEITQPTSKDRTACCCLSSLNVARWEEWKDNPLFIQDVMEMLDNVLEVFIQTAPPELGRAVYAASRERSVGLGWMGFHDLLQQRRIAYGSLASKRLNTEIAAHIREGCEAADAYLCALRGPCPDAEASGVQRRFSHWMAGAPTATSSINMGNTSPWCEPYRANVYRQNTISGSHVHYNPNLKRELNLLGLDTEEVWASIIAHEGSVQHLSEIPERIREVYLTAMEIDQRWIIDLAADRQQYICQSQSTNLFFPADASIAEVHAAHFEAWTKGLKTLYYLRSTAVVQTESVGHGEREAGRLRREAVSMIEIASGNACVACES